jgi:hypothetical protein
VDFSPLVESEKKIVRIYRNHYSTEGGTSDGYSFHSSKAHAHQAVKDAKLTQEEDFEDPLEIAEPLDIELTKEGVLRFLNIFASHADNG